MSNEKHTLDELDQITNLAEELEQIGDDFDTGVTKAMALEQARARARIKELIALYGLPAVEGQIEVSHYDGLPTFEGAHTIKFKYAPKDLIASLQAQARLDAEKK